MSPPRRRPGAGSMSSRPRSFRPTILIPGLRSCRAPKAPSPPPSGSRRWGCVLPASPGVSTPMTGVGVTLHQLHPLRTALHHHLQSAPTTGRAPAWLAELCPGCAAESRDPCDRRFRRAQCLSGMRAATSSSEATAFSAGSRSFGRNPAPPAAGRNRRNQGAGRLSSGVRRCQPGASPPARAQAAPHRPRPDGR